MLNKDKAPVFVSGDAFRTFAQAIYSSIDNKDTDTFSQLNSFIYSRLSNSFESNNTKSFEQFSGLFVWYYEYALNKLNLSITYKDIYDICADRSARGLREKLGWGFHFYSLDKEMSIDEKKRINEFSKILLNRFAELISVCLRHKDLAHLTFILNELNQSYRSYNHELSDLKFKVLMKRRENPQGDALNELIALEDKYAVEGYLNNTVRLLFKVTLFWSFFLYEMGVLKTDELQKILTLFDGYRWYIEDQLLDDMLFLRKPESEFDYAWGRWDYMERLSGVTYSPPTVSIWVTIGMILYLLRYKININIETENKDPEKINATESLLSSMLEIANSLSKAGYNKWGNVIQAKDEHAFNNQVTLLINRLTDLKNTAITNRERIIAQKPLDANYVSNFKKIMCEGWVQGNDVRKIFNYFQNTKNIDDEEEIKKLFQLGARNQVWQGYKTSLINDPELSISIFGVERHGQGLADTEENIFLSLFSGEETTEDIDLLSELDKSIVTLTEKGFSASLILCGIDTWHSNIQDLKSPDFVFNWDDKQGFPFFHFGGTYKKIPIVYFKSQLIKNSVVVSDFKKAFALNQKADEEAYEHVLHANIQEITEQKAISIIAENPNYWRKNLSEDEAKIKLMNSVLVDFYLIENFTIENNDAFSIIRLKS